MNSKEVKVKLTWNTGYSMVVLMSEYAYNYYTTDRQPLSNPQFHCIDWSTKDRTVAVSFDGLIAMEIVED